MKTHVNSKVQNINQKGQSTSFIYWLLVEIRLFNVFSFLGKKNGFRDSHEKSARYGILVKKQWEWRIRTPFQILFYGSFILQEKAVALHVCLRETFLCFFPSVSSWFLSFQYDRSDTANLNIVVYDITWLSSGKSSEFRILCFLAHAAPHC